MGTDKETGTARMPIVKSENTMPMWARCNFDGRTISARDQWFIDTFAIWLRMDDQERLDAVRLDPEWRKFALGDTLSKTVKEVFCGNESPSGV